MPQLPLTFTFVDNNGREASTGMHIAPPPSAADIESVVLAYSAALSAVSSAAIVRAQYTQFVAGLPLTSAQAGSDVYTRLVLLFREGEWRDSISLPSPAALPFDLAGAYRDVRLTRQALDLSGLLGPVESAVSVLCDRYGRPFARDFVVAGKAR